MVKTSCSQFRGHGLDPQPRNYVARHDQKETKKIYIYIYILCIFQNLHLQGGGA